MHERAVLLADSVGSSLPHFTRHEQSHLDALWEMADIAAGAELTVTAAEAFVLGGAFLIHDLGLGIAAYPGGVDELKNDPRFDDRLAILRQRNTSSTADANEANLEAAAVEWLLVELHAERAEQLAQLSWDSKDQRFWLIESMELRSTYGPLIGRIAHSHWWETDRLAQEFDTTLGARAWAPNSWTVDPLKLAALLRIADAIHVDSRRAPAFARVLRNVNGESRNHWIFQEKLQKPQVDAERLVFTAGAPFTIEEADAWWLCHDYLQQVQRWLRETDSLLADSGRPRLSSRSIAGVDGPERLARFVPTAGWLPVNASLSVGDVAGLAEKLGGEALYGRDMSVVLRELLQNASDAIRARRAVENRPDDWGAIVVRVGGNAPEDRWLEVEDNGVGMSETTLTGTLLDFGASLWRSDKVTTELPGLAASGFAATGRYGLGFFAVFMLGSNVSVSSRFYTAARSQAKTLIFRDGTRGRPILSTAASADRPLDGGTKIRVVLRASAFADLGSRALWSDDVARLSRYVERLAPNLDVTVRVETCAGHADALRVGDWRTLDPSRLIDRTDALVRSASREPELTSLAAERVREIFVDGAVAGRAAIVPARPRAEDLAGCLTVGGLRSCDLQCVAGFMAGDALRASRDLARPLADDDELARWATQQAELWVSAPLPAWELIEVAKVVHMFHGDTGPLPIAFYGGRWVTGPELEQEQLPHEVTVAYLRGVPLDTIAEPGVTIDSNVVVTSFGWRAARKSSVNGDDFAWPRHETIRVGSLNPYANQGLHGAVIARLAASWDDDLVAVWEKSESVPWDDRRALKIGVAANGSDIMSDDYSFVRNSRWQGSGSS